MSMPTCQVSEFSEHAFDDLPHENRVRIFGVDYARLSLKEGGELFVTRPGWDRLPALEPKRWFLGHRYSKEGSRLTGGTGNVYRLPVPAPTKADLSLVVKFARTGQDVPLLVKGTFPGAVSSEDIDQARWNSPFEEFGLLEDLRRGRFGPQDIPVLTKRPLAIYCPPSHYKNWQLGRHLSVWHQMQVALDHAQQITSGDDPVVLHASRLYVMLFEWIEGINAEDCCEQGIMTEAEMLELTKRVVAELDAKGFRVLDNKPRHFILRLGADGKPRVRNGKIVYGLVDFELLKRTAAYEDWLRAQSTA